MVVKGKKVSVIGMARSGVAAANFLSGHGAQVTVFDQKPEADLKDAAAALQRGIQKRFGGSVPDADSDLVVVSPGVDIDSPDLQEVKNRGVEIIGEIELAYRFCNTPLIAVTGTNGKSTTATLIGALLKAAGMDAAVCGNIGAPLVGCLGKPPRDYLVVEVSSFQLETVRDFRPDIALILNLTPDHLDRHKTMERYAGLKERITARQNANDTLILNRDDAWARRMGEAGPARRVFFSLTGNVETGACLYEGKIILNRLGAGREVMPVAALPLAARCQIDNILAALAAADGAGVPVTVMREVLSGFTGLEHRLEWVRTLRGVDFINDSKGTNVGAVQKSLSGFDRPVILIMGGRDKGASFAPLKNILKARVKHMVLIGEAKPKIQAVLNGSFGHEDAASMEDAVRRAWSEAQPGDVVLLSPGCASFDMFRDFEDRGRQFKDAVHRL